jgi:hypothetical protein
MRYSLSFLASVALIFLSDRPGAGAVIFSTFGPSDSYDSSSGQALYQLSLLGETLNRGVAVSFIPAANVHLGEILVAINAPSKPFTLTVANNFDFTIFGGTEGPNGAVEVFDVTGSSSPEILMLTSKTNPLLTGGTKYWIEINAGNAWNFPTDQGTWFNNNQGIVGQVSVNDEFCKLPCAPFTQEEIAPAVEVLSFDTNAPEPASTALFAAGLMTIVILRFRRSVTNSVH